MWYNECMWKYAASSIKILLLLGLLAEGGLLLAKKIDLTTADLGRHIANGEILLHGSNTDRHGVLYTNFYSYTLPNQPFINHHWLSGVVFYLIYIISGFVGLSVFYVVLGLLTLLLFFDVARKCSNFWIAAATTIIVMPLIASRAEVRPEMFTYFFSGVFFWALYYWRIGILKYNRLLVLPAVMLLWVNLHIGFVFGFLVLGAFGLEQLIRGFIKNPSGFNFRIFAAGAKKLLLLILLKHQSAKGGLKLRLQIIFHTASKFLQKKSNGFIWLVFIFGLCLVAGLITPFGFKILIYPFLIFKNYGYLIVENQSVRFLETLNHTDGLHFFLLKIIMGSAAFLFILSAIKNLPRPTGGQVEAGWRKFDIAMFVLVLVTAAMAYLGIRNFPSFAFFALPALAGSFYSLKPTFKLHIAYVAGLGLLCASLVGLSLYHQRQDFKNLKPILGLGLMPEAAAGADFYKAQKIAGPVFNNYDVGGYLIYSLRQTDGHGLGQRMDTEGKVFVDNRPEAYTNDFFQNIYIPAQQDEQKWQELDSQYKFNSIFFAWHDLTPWAQTFLINRVNDKNWVPVFADSYNLIFVRLARKNLDIISKYEIPRERFSVYKN